MLSPLRAPHAEFKVRCETCFYRSRWPTPEQATADALRHRATNGGHTPKIRYPRPSQTVEKHVAQCTLKSAGAAPRRGDITPAPSSARTPRCEAPDVDVVVVQAGEILGASEFNLQLHFLLANGHLANRARRAHAGAANGSIAPESL